MEAANGKINVLFKWSSSIFHPKKQKLLSNFYKHILHILKKNLFFFKKEVLKITPFSNPFFSTLCLILILTFLNGQVVETNSFGFDNDDEFIVVDPFAPDSDLDENGYDSRRPRVCPPGQKLVEKPEGLVCKTDYSLQYVNPRNLPNINNDGKNFKKMNEITKLHFLKKNSQQ